MSTYDNDVSSLIKDAKLQYEEYAQSQKDFQIPLAHISIERESDETTQVHMEVQYKGTEYQFRSIEEKDVNDIYQYLNSQLVREKYADGNTASLQATITRVNTFVQRFINKTSPLYLYSGFVLEDSQTETFLGIANLGGGSQTDTSEMAFLNRLECWSRPNNINNRIGKTYSGIGTVETCTLLQYASRLKEEGYLINGHPLRAVIATSRVDNEGSWKSCAKAGMMLQDISVLQRYGTELRYQLTKDI